MCVLDANKTKEVRQYSYKKSNLLEMLKGVNQTLSIYLEIGPISILLKILFNFFPAKYFQKQ